MRRGGGSALTAAWSAPPSSRQRHADDDMKSSEWGTCSNMHDAWGGKFLINTGRDEDVVLIALAFSETEMIIIICT